MRGIHAVDASQRVTIEINGGARSVTMKRGMSLLEGLGSNGVYLPSACGGFGSCATCKVRIVEGGSPHMPTEIPYLSAREMADNVHLSCQFRPITDARIQVSEGQLRAELYDCRVEEIVDISQDMREIRVALPAGRAVEFAGGQYCQIEVPPHDGIPVTRRGYSITSSPTRCGALEFMVQHVPGGIVSSYLHRKLTVGQHLRVVAPFGEFGVHDQNAPMIFIAAGSGIAPFRSIIQERIDRDLMAKSDIRLFYGARTEEELCYLDWLRSLSERYRRFHLVAVLSEPRSDWFGESGRLADLLQGYLTHIHSAEPGCEAYLCGGPATLDACMNVLRQNGVPEQMIHFDKFS